MTEQEIRAKALEIALMNPFIGKFLFDVKGGNIVFGKEHFDILRALEKYIDNGTCNEHTAG